MTLLVNRTTNRSVPRFLPEDGDLLARNGQARLLQELRHVVVDVMNQDISDTSA